MTDAVSRTTNQKRTSWVVNVKMDDRSAPWWQRAEVQGPQQSLMSDDTRIKVRDYPVMTH